MRISAAIFAAIGIWLTVQSPASPADLSGIWASEQSFGPLVKGTLKIDAHGNAWYGSIAGFDVPIAKDGSEIRFTVPGDRGEFRGRLAADRKSIAGHWIQPASRIFNQRYATPVTLTEMAPSVWQGDVVPLEERLSFYISIRRMPDGAFSAMIRNPEFGWLNGRYQVEVQGSSIRLSSPTGQVNGTYDQASHRLLLNLVNGSPAPTALTQCSEDGALGFFPRSTRERADYRYSQPLRQNDGWPTASLAEVELDPKLLTELVQSVLKADPNDAQAIPLHSLLIARHGKLVLEEYFHGFDRERTHNTRSAGKTLAPILIGAVREHGAKVAPNTPIYSLFFQYKPFANWDERKNRVTVEDIMTMTPGWDCDDNKASSPGGENNLQSRQNDWYKYTLDLPMVRDPGGTVAIYCSASLNLVGGVAERAAGRWNAELFRDYIAVPLQFGNYHLNLMPTGSVYTGGGAEIRPRDALKLGQLYLSGGLWNGKRVISESWVRESTMNHSRFANRVVETDANHEYGYGWHIHTFVVGGHSYREYAAEGAGGQLVMVIPDLDLVVGINAGDYRSRNWYAWMLDVIPKYFIPAAASRH
jgi:CubicO group peptidase (beta-lactamase class C family)